MADVKDIAQLFIQLGDGDDVTNLKVQKLVYYTQGFYLALNGKPLFNNDIKAWAHGPVVPELYQEYKGFGKQAIELTKKFNPHVCLTKAEIEHVELIYEVFGQFSAWKLRNMTHEEKPWIDNEADAGTITKDELKRYFLTRVE